MRNALTALVFVAAGIALVVLAETSGLRGARILAAAIVAGLAGVCAARTTGRVRDLAVTVCSLALGLTAIFALLPILVPGTGRDRPTATRTDNLVAKRAVVGWGPPHPGVYHLVKADADGHVVFDVHATIDADLLRKTVPSAGPHPVAFFGDSFVFGDGLDDGDTLPQAFADLNHGDIPVLNLGFSGWAPSQNLAMLEQGLERKPLGRPRRLILFTALFHVERTACKGPFALGSGPRYVLDGQTVRSAGSCVGSGRSMFSAVMGFLRGLTHGAGASEPPTARDVETYIAIIETFVTRARRDYGVDTTVLMEPGDDDLVAGTGYDQATIVAALRSAGVDVLVKADPPRGQERLYRIAEDGHPTGLANRATAREIEAHLRAVAPSVLDATIPRSDDPTPVMSQDESRVAR